MITTNFFYWQEIFQDAERREYFDSDEDECDPSSKYKTVPHPRLDDADETEEEIEPDLETLSAAIRLTVSTEVGHTGQYIYFPCSF